MRLLSLLLVAATTVATYAATPLLDAAGRNTLRMEKQSHPARSASDEPRTYRSAIIELDEAEAESTLEELQANGVVILHRRDELVLACLPTDIFGDYDFEPHPNGVRGISLATHLTPQMDLARRMTHTDEAQAGADLLGPLPCGYDGTGVVAGVVDCGFDPAHPAFADRVGMFVNYNDTLAAVEKAYGHAQACSLVTDNPAQTHATHVANIMGGSRTAQSYHGAAPGADLAFAGSLLLDVGILAGVEDIIAYAKEQGRPAVINMSLGAYNGPHDGTDLFCRYLDRCAEDAVIVLSAGNEGCGHSHIAHRFTPESPLVRTSLQTNLGWNGNHMLGRTDIWATQTSDFSLRLSIIDIQIGTYTALTDWIPAGQPDADFIMDSSDPRLAPYYEGRMAVASGRSDQTGRTCIVFDYELHSKALHEGHGWSRYYLVLEVTAPEGTEIDMHTDAEYSYFNNLSTSALTLGGALISISNIACGRNTISVGAAVTRPLMEGIDRTKTDWGVPSETIAEFSSYAELRDGRLMPLIAAPGCQIISAGSGPHRRYLEENNSKTHDLVATEPDSYAYWYGESGTSMASPHAAGIFALWLQADPTLTTDDIRRIATTTARRDFDDISDPRWGAGCIDAMAGLRAILSDSSVASTPLKMTLILSADGRRIKAESLAGRDVELKIYNLRGQQLSAEAELAPGIYTARASDGQSTLIQKIAIR